MHNLDQFFVQLANAVVNVWRARNACDPPSLFTDPAEARRSRRWLTVVAVVVTLLALAVAAAVIYLLWWGFTIDQRQGN